MFVLTRVNLLVIFLCPVMLFGAEPVIGIPGAVPDDGKDDSAALNQAFEAAKPGDVFLLPEGTFHIAARVRLSSGVTLKGSGQDKTRLVFAGEKRINLIELKELSGVEICQLTIDGLNSPMAGQGIVASKSSKIYLHHLTIQNFVDTGSFGPHAILLSGTSDSVISDNTIRNIAPEDEWGAGMRVGDHSLRCVIERNNIDNTGRGGIFTNNGATDAEIRDNVITRSGGIGFAIEVHSGSVRTVIEDNVVDHGLSIVSGNCAVRRNIVTDADGRWKAYGIEGGGGPDGIVTDNIIHYGQIMGISMSGGHTRRIFWGYNQFVCCSMWGMQIQGQSDEKNIHSLYFYKNSFSRTMKGHPSVVYKGADGHAIRLNNHVSNIVFDSNRIENNGGQGFQILGKDVNRLTFVNNVIANNRSASIRNYPGDTVLWANNLVAGNKTNIVFKTCGDFGVMPQASFTVQANARVGEKVSFKNTSKDVENIEHVLWDFDDGIPCMEINPVHIYPKPGLYRINLLVWNKDGNVARAKECMIRVQ
ncbi:MAG: right-handed parallel beta-helix repeat-containing protein [Kiritimatiellae bacterium]|jgi:hypothetical protein|nr:right-handed parallel beta-helix repeat-containing protein [Kiritimatiellia bacterium]